MPQSKDTSPGSLVGRYLHGDLFKRDLLLVAFTLAAFGGVCWHDLVNLDDNKYVQNFAVESGLVLENLDWGFKTFEASNWHPFTWLSLQFDADLFGPKPWAFHAMNLLYHLANVLILAEVLRRMTGRVWASAAVAAFFGVHPQHAESVAWVSERKDVLSTFFGLLALAAYVRYARQPSIMKMLWVCLLFAASLMSKPMLVTLPCLLLLLDYWPLGRLRRAPDASGEFARASPLRLVVEKLPLFLLVAGSCIMTVIAQRSGGAVKSLDRFPMSLRIDNALWSTLCYLGQTFWPADLAAYYPYPVEGIPSPQVAGAALLLASVTLIVCLRALSRPYLMVGWFWFLGTLIPVSGLVQVGSQARADRYTYFPSIGLYLMLIWGLFEKVSSRKWNFVLAVPVVAALLACVWLTRVQAGYWAHSRTLWEHTIAVTPDNFFAQTKYGEALARQGKREDALKAYAEAVRIYPKMDPALSAMGDIYLGQGEWEKAEECYLKAIEARPDLRVYQIRLENLFREMKKRH